MSKPQPKLLASAVRERAVRVVQEHQGEYESQWAAIRAIAEKLGCSAGTLRSCVRRAERDAGHRPGLTCDERERRKALERESRELERADEILRKASAHLAPPPNPGRSTHAGSRRSGMRLP